MSEHTTETETVVEPVEEPVETEETTETETEVETEETEEEPETFPREYVERLRKENAKYRDRAGRADDLAQRLHAALTAATGRLAAPDELPFDEAHLDDPEALTTAIDELLARKPYLAARRPVGDVGQGATGTTPAVDLGGILRGLAG